MKPPPPPSKKRMAPSPGQPARGETDPVGSLRGPTPTGLVVPVAPSWRAPDVPPPPRSRPGALGADGSGGRGNEQLVGNMLDGRFVVDGILGEGGMGTVYSGHDLVDNCRVAIKLLRADYLSDSEIVQRFLNEAQAASRIGSAHICSVFGIGGAPNGAAYFVMEFLDGVSLSQLLERERVLSIRRILRIGSQIAAGLSTAHAAGIIHRDLKPDNVMLVSGAEQPGAPAEFVKIVDFGVAKIASSNTKLTRAGSVFGTPQYMSPEQAAGSVVDARADVYSLGIILYEMAAGAVPFDDENMMNVLSHQMFREPPAVRDVAPQVVPDEFNALVRKCLQKDPKLRFASMYELAAELERIAQVLPAGQFETVIHDSKRPFADTGARGLSATVPELGRPRAPSRLRFWLAGGVAAIALGGVGAALFMQRDAHEATAEMPAVTPASTPAPPSVRTVSLSVTPPGASVVRNGVEQPRAQVGSVARVVIELPAAETATVRVTAAGFVEQTVALSPELGSSIAVALRAEIPAAGASAPAHARGGSRGKVGGKGSAAAKPAPAAAPPDPAPAKSKCNPASPSVDPFGECVR